MSSRFEQQLDLVPDGPSSWRVALSDAWNCPFVPHGGVATAVAARAMELALDDPSQPLRSITSVFAAPVAAGPACASADVLRRGRSMSQVTATLRSEGAAAGLTAVAVFGAERPGFSFTDVTMPVVPRAAMCPSFRDRPPEAPAEVVPFNFWEHVEGRPASGHAPWESYVPTTSERCAWYRFDEPPVSADDGTWEPLAIVALCDTMPGAVGERLGPAGQVVPWLPPSADLTVHVLGPCRSPWVLMRNRARFAGDGYASLEIELWDPSVRPGGRLVAYGTQLMFFSFPDGPPPEEARRPTGAA